MKYLDSTLSFIAPHHCLNCQKEGSVCCQKCLNEIADSSAGRVCYRCNKTSATLGICKACKLKQSLDSVVWYADYNNPLAAQLVKSLKFDGLYDASRPISTPLSSRIIKESIKGRVVITSAPTAGKRARARGWDQAKIIAKKLAKNKKLPYKSLLVRTSSFDQIGSTKSERAEASHNFFKAHRKHLIKNTTIILIDDVITTGSTLTAAAGVLKLAGAKEVHGVVFVRQGINQRKTTKL